MHAGRLRPLCSKILRRNAAANLTRATPSRVDAKGSDLYFHPRSKPGPIGK
jgi:hypothetical protein